jgi:hypothetical protein
MTTRYAAFSLLLLTPFLCSASAKQGIVCDGSLDAAYGDAASVQETATGFGNADLGLETFANGSELDAGYVRVDGGYVTIFLAGNLESNFNKLDLFIDGRGGGQNTLRGDNSDADYDGLNRMGLDAKNNGLTFDEGFSADLWVTVTCGGKDFVTYASWAELRTDGGGDGGYIGEGGAGADGTIHGDNGILVGLNNANVAGVSDGCGPSCGTGVATGIEIAVPVYLFDWDGKGGDVSTPKICVFINGSDHGHMSNQVLGGIGYGANLGDPRLVDFNDIPGQQYFTLGDTSLPCPETSGGCCISEECTIQQEGDCLATGGVYGGDGSCCDDGVFCVPEPCRGDTNEDGIVNVTDLLIIIEDWGCEN